MMLYKGMRQLMREMMDSVDGMTYALYAKKWKESAVIQRNLTHVAT